MKKEYYKKRLILAFFSDCYAQNQKVNAKPTMWEN